MKSTHVALVALGFILPALQAAQPFTVALSDDFTVPEVASRGPIQSFAYSRSSVKPGVKALFQITVVSIPPERRGDSLEKMLTGMLGGIERRRTEFKKSQYVKSTLGSEESLSVDWEGIGEGHAMKGRMICAVSDGRMFCVHFQDLASAWEKSLDDAKKALQTFAFSK